MLKGSSGKGRLSAEGRRGGLCTGVNSRRGGRQGTVSNPHSSLWF